MTDKLELTRMDRLMLANQYRIMSALYPSDAETYERFYTIVVRGYELDFASLLENIDRDTMSKESSRFVMDVLDMHRALHDGFKKLGSADGIKESDIAFSGFDGNNESDMLGYVRFLVMNDRWTDVVSVDRADSFNSHCPMVEIYQRMLEQWNKCDNKNTLTSSDICAILDARLHPSNRM